MYLMGWPTSIALFARVGTYPPHPVFSSLRLTSTKHRRLPCSSRDKEYDVDRQGDPERVSEQAAKLRREITDLERDLASLKMSGASSVKLIHTSVLSSIAFRSVRIVRFILKTVTRGLPVLLQMNRVKAWSQYYFCACNIG